ncbi:MAG: 50S ribosomal protein L30 [Turicibacter sp.]|nr:50S ribosomal protein L30 [Turicibacter sp.]
MAKIKVTLVRSTIGAIPKHRQTVAALGLRKINSSNVHEDNVAIRGMIARVRHLVKVDNI